MSDYLLSDIDKPKYVHGMVQRALKSGLLKKSPCIICGSTKVIAHHQDYAKPLDVMWMCKAHHRRWHNAMTESGKAPKNLHLSASRQRDINKKRLVASTVTLLLLTSGLGLPPKNSLWKGQAMQDPTCGRRSTPISSFKSTSEASDSHTDDLRFLQGELFAQPVQVLNVSSGESDSSDLLNGLHKSTITDTQQFVVQADNNRNTKDIQSIAAISDSGNSVGISSEVTDCPSQSSSPSPLDWLLNPSKAAPRLGELGSSGRVEEIYDRILARLIQCEAHEREASLRDDYRIAWLIVRFCQTGEAKLCTPQVLATYKVIGCHPDQVWHRIVARRQAFLGWRPVSVIRPIASAANPPRPAAKAALAPPNSKKELA